MKLRLHDTIARNLGLDIVAGRCNAGELLANEIDASGQLKVSRTAYREALRILAAKGLVHSRPKVGTRISVPECWNLLDRDVLSWLFESEPDEKLLESLFELRKIIEPEAAALAATRRTREHLGSMQFALHDLAQYPLTTEFGLTADQDFHSTILRAAGNAFLISLTSGIASAITWATVFKQRANCLARDPIPDHQRVYDAIEAADAVAARRSMLTLIEQAFNEAVPLARKKKTRPRRSI
jgi:DNA-binding FadR family transcriptional regulator